MRLLLLLGGDIERNPGPRRARALQPRGPLDTEAGYAPSTTHKMRKAFAAFVEYLVAVQGVVAESVFEDNRATEAALRSFGLHLFEHGFPRYLLVYAITAVQNRFPAYRHHLAAAWQVDLKWRLAEPGECRAVLPAGAIRAMLALGALWGWRAWTGLLLLGFLAMLHPAEMIGLTRRDLVFPADNLGHVRCLYVRLLNPKTSRFAHRQHGKIDDMFAVEILETIFGALPRDALLYPASMHTFRRYWDMALQRLEIPCRAADRGATPGVLRGSGATYFYQQTENLQLLAWRGRWSRMRTLEYYLQEVAAQMLLGELAPGARARVGALDQACDQVLYTVFCCGGASQY